MLCAIHCQIPMRPLLCKLLLVHGAFVFFLVATPAFAQFDAQCASALSCNPSQESLMNDPLQCVRARLAPGAQSCKLMLLPEFEYDISILFVLPFIFFAGIVMWGAYKLPPSTGWAHGATVGAIVCGFVLCAESDLLPFLSFSKPYLSHILFPVTGVLSFSPSFVSSFPFGFQLFAAHVIVYAGAYGLLNSKHPYAKIHSVLFAVCAILLSFYDALLV